MNKRQFLRTMPLLAMGGIAVKVCGRDAKAFEIKPSRKYLLAVPGIEDDDALRFKKTFRENGFGDVVITNTDDFQLYEMQK